MLKHGSMFRALESGAVRKPSLPGDTVREQAATKGDYVQMIAMRDQLGTFIAALPESIAGQTLSAVALAIIADLERKKIFPQAHYALAGRLLTPELARLIENEEKHWVGQLEGSCPIQWEGPWARIEQVAEQLCHSSPESFREARIQNADATCSLWYIFTRSVRLDSYGRKRIVIAYNSPDLSDTPLYLFTDALYWEGRRVVQMWQYRWDEQFFL